jgi:hypothetical protein
MKQMIFRKNSADYEEIVLNLKKKRMAFYAKEEAPCDAGGFY